MQMKDAKTGDRNKRYLWRCRDCKEQYTVRIGTVYEESRLAHLSLVHMRSGACNFSKKGVSALDIKRHCQISYKSCTVSNESHPLSQCLQDFVRRPRSSKDSWKWDETYVGGKSSSRRQAFLLD